MGFWRAVFLAGTVLAAAGCTLSDGAAKVMGFPSFEEMEARMQRLRETLPRSRVLVLPQQIDGERWVSGEAMGRQLQPVCGSVMVLDRAPHLGPLRAKPTQYRYAAVRAKQLAEWVRAARPDADYVWFSEVSTGRVPAGRFFVFDRDGLFMGMGMVHWGHRPPADEHAAAAMIVEGYERRLQRSGASGPQE